MSGGISVEDALRRMFAAGPMPKGAKVTKYPTRQRARKPKAAK